MSVVQDLPVLESIPAPLSVPSCSRPLMVPVARLRQFPELLHAITGEFATRYGDFSNTLTAGQHPLMVESMQGPAWKDRRCYMLTVESGAGSFAALVDPARLSGRTGSELINLIEEAHQTGDQTVNQCNGRTHIEPVADELIPPQRPLITQKPATAPAMEFAPSPEDRIATVFLRFQSAFEHPDGNFLDVISLGEEIIDHIGVGDLDGELEEAPGMDELRRYVYTRMAVAYINNRRMDQAEPLLEYVATRLGQESVEVDTAA